METYQQTYTISVMDMDISYRITPNAILHYFQDTFARFLTTRRLAAFDIIKKNLIWVITDFETTFVKERPLWSSEVRMKVQINEISLVRISLGYQFYDSNDEVFAEGTSTWAMLDTVSRRPFPCKEMMEAGGMTETGVVPKRTRLPKAPDHSLVQSVHHQVNVTDLDFNGHVSNRTYLAIALGTFTPEFIRNFSPRYLHIKFKKESFFGQSLTCNVCQDENHHFWYDILNGEGEDLCNVYAEWEEHETGYAGDVSDLIPRK